MNDLEQRILSFLESSSAEIVQANTVEDIERIRIQYLGRKAGMLNTILRSLASLSGEERARIGQLGNKARADIEQALESRATEIQKNSDTSKNDFTLPGIHQSCGHLHPMTHVLNELMDIFQSMGFMIYEGPEIDSEFYNFEAVNMPSWHPARDIQDTFFVNSSLKRKDVSKERADDNRWVMRTHTTNMQVRIMEQFQPPLRCIIPGRAFRNESTDASHEHTFYQLEGFVVDEAVSVGQLVWTLKEIFRRLYKKDVDLRLRPGYFPFTEPSFEPDLSCTFCGQNNSACRVCKGSGWIEMGGSGMIHPKVFEYAGYPKGKYTGFAFGMGPNRLAMLQYGIPDIRMFMENDIRFLEQFS